MEKNLAKATKFAQLCYFNKSYRVSIWLKKGLDFKNKDYLVKAVIISSEKNIKKDSARIENYLLRTLQELKIENSFFEKKTLGSQVS